MENNSKIVVALLAGLAAGTALGLLFAPDKGEETIDKLSRSLSDLKNKLLDGAHDELERLVETSKEFTAGDADKYGSVGDGLTGKVDELKQKTGDQATNTIEPA